MKRSALINSSKRQKKQNVNADSPLTKKKQNEDGRQKKLLNVSNDLLGMDDLFKEAANKVKQANEKKRAEQEAEEKKHAIEKAERKKKLQEFKCDDVKPKRFDPDLGMPIYSAEDLRIGQGGNSKDCPFDCNCCF